MNTFPNQSEINAGIRRAHELRSERFHLSLSRLTGLIRHRADAQLEGEALR